MTGIAINTRVLSGRLAGVQRYTWELLKRWDGVVERVSPAERLNPLAGHLWEQVVLPSKVKGRVLFSPSNTGPVKKIKQVVTIHDMSVFDCPEGFNRFFAAWYRFLLPRLARQVDSIIADSEFTKGRIVVHTKVPEEKIAVIHCGVSSEFSPKSSSNLGSVVERLGLPSPHYILAVGSLEPRKNLRRLFEAWCVVKKESFSQSVWLVVAGAAGNSNVFADAGLHSLPERVFLAGHVDQDLLPALYAGAIAMVYPSMYEGFGLPVLEAMASGTPVLVGDRSSLPEIAGGVGILVNPDSVKEIADGVCELLQNERLRGELSEKGLQRAKEFSWDDAARDTWIVLQRVASED